MNVSETIDEAAPRVAVPRLADTPDVDDRLLVGQLEPVVQLVGAVEVGPFQEHARHVRVAAKAELVEPLEKLTNLPGLV